MSHLSTASATEPVKTSYVVYLYVDYSKEIGARVVRSYFNRQKAIDFAESLSTKYVGPNEEEDDPVSEPEYTVLAGSEFDSNLRIPKDRLVEFGLIPRDVSSLWYTRVAVDAVQHFDD